MDVSINQTEITSEAAKVSLTKASVLKGHSYTGGQRSGGADTNSSITVQYKTENQSLIRYSWMANLQASLSSLQTLK